MRKPGTKSRILGHCSVSVTQRYVALNDGDLAASHLMTSPVDRM